MLLIISLTESMDYSPSPEAKSFSAIKKLPTFYLRQAVLKNPWPCTEHLNMVMKPTNALKCVAHWIYMCICWFRYHT